MELLRPNFIDTTSSFSVDSNTVTAAYLFNPDPTFQYVSQGYANDLTTTSVVVTFDETTTISRIALAGINLKQFTIFYNGVTANTFSLSTTAATVTSAWSSNSESSLYLAVTPVACLSVTLDMRSTQMANQEKAVGYFVLSSPLLVFPQIPSAKGYKPKLDPTDVVHKLSDGGTRIQRVAKKWTADLSLEYIEETFRDSLRELFDQASDMVFVPFGTTAGWDEVIFPCVWDGDFGFYKFSDDAVAAGFSGSIRLKETST